MKLIWAILTSFVWATACFAQTPVVKAELSAETTTLGQPLILRVTVLVPTFMPSPPDLPSFEVPDLMVRLNGRATTPTSQQVEGDTWSGVTRSYSLYPMRAGSFTLPPQDVRITFRGEGNADETTTIPTDPVMFTSEVPEGAEGMDPPLLAQSVAVTQTIDVPEGELSVGSAISRTVESKITGTSALFLPPLLTALETDALRAYPKDPQITESENRGILSGTRTETVSYVATQSGQVTLPPISLSWFNLKSGEIETIELEGADFEIAAGPETIEGGGGPDWQRVAVALALLCGLGWLGYRFVWPRLKAMLEAKRTAYRASARFRFKELKKAVHTRDLTLTVQRLDSFRTAQHVPLTPEVHTALRRIMAARYGSDPSAEGAESDWKALERALPGLWKSKAKRQGKAALLPRLNPE